MYLDDEVDLGDEFLFGARGPVYRVERLVAVVRVDLGAGVRFVLFRVWCYLVGFLWRGFVGGRRCWRRAFAALRFGRGQLSLSQCYLVVLVFQVAVW